MRQLGLFVVAAFAAGGCGGGDGRLAVHPASGKLTLDGKPLARAQVWLLPRDKAVYDAAVQVRPQGPTDEAGEFKLSTYLFEDGAPVGEYDVFVLPPGGAGAGDADGGDGEPTPKRSRGLAVPRKYLDAKTSGLTASVQSGGNRFEFALKSR